MAILIVPSPQNFIVVHYYCCCSVKVSPHFTNHLQDNFWQHLPTKLAIAVLILFEKLLILSFLDSFYLKLTIAVT